MLERFRARFRVLRATFWSDSGTIVGSLLKRVEVEFRHVGGSPRCCPCWLNLMFVLFLALRLACFLSLPRDRARKLRKRRTRNSRLCLVVLCLASSRRCLCSSPRLLRRLRCLRLSLLTRFPFLDSQGFSVFSNPSNFSKNATLSKRKRCFLRSGGSQNGAKMTSNLETKSSSGAGGLRESLGERFWEVLGGPKMA